MTSGVNLVGRILSAGAVWGILAFGAYNVPDHISPALVGLIIGVPTLLTFWADLGLLWTFVAFFVAVAVGGCIMFGLDGLWMILQFIGGSFKNEPTLHSTLPHWAALIYVSLCVSLAVVFLDLKGDSVLNEELIRKVWRWLTWMGKHPITNMIALIVGIGGLILGIFSYLLGSPKP